jgi:signal transduction histidine kinase
MRRDTAHTVCRREFDGARHSPEMITSGRPLPHVRHALGRFFKAAAADWERREAELRRREEKLRKSEAYLAEAQRRSEEALGKLRSELLELTDDLPPVMGDRIQVQQVIMNLRRNARTPERPGFGRRFRTGRRREALRRVLHHEG